MKNQLLLAIRAIEKDSKLNVKTAAKIYNIRRTTLQHRIHSRPTRRSIRANNHKLTEAEEDTIVKIRYNIPYITINRLILIILIR